MAQRIVPDGAGGPPARVIIDNDMLQRIQSEVEQGLNAAEPVARAVLQTGAAVSVAASAASVKATIGMPSVDPVVDASAAAATVQLARKIDESVNRSMPPVRDGANRLVRASVTTVNNSFR